MTFAEVSRLEIIREYAFYGCSSLDSVTFQAGSQLENIGDVAFGGCSKLSMVKVEAVIPPTLGVSVFNATDAGLKIQVPSSSVDAYKTADNWSTYKDKIEPITF